MFVAAVMIKSAACSTVELVAGTKMVNTWLTPWIVQSYGPGKRFVVPHPPAIASVIAGLA